MNIMCTHDDSLLALLDWGDAGWGDPTLEFAMIPLPAIPFVMEGYECDVSGLLGNAPEMRIVWDKLRGAMEALLDDPAHPLTLDQFHTFMRSGKA